MIPKVPYTPDFRDAKDNYRREYFDFFLNLGSPYSYIQPAVDYTNYKKGLYVYTHLI